MTAEANITTPTYAITLEQHHKLAATINRPITDKPVGWHTAGRREASAIQSRIATINTDTRHDTISEMITTPRSVLRGRAWHKGPTP